MCLLETTERSDKPLNLSIGPSSETPQFQMGGESCSDVTCSYSDSSPSLFTFRGPFTLTGERKKGIPLVGRTMSSEAQWCSLRHDERFRLKRVKRKRSQWGLGISHCCCSALCSYLIQKQQVILWYLFPLFSSPRWEKRLSCIRM